MGLPLKSEKSLRGNPSSLAASLGEKMNAARWCLLITQGTTRRIQTAAIAASFASQAAKECCDLLLAVVVHFTPSIGWAPAGLLQAVPLEVKALEVGEIAQTRGHRSCAHASR